MSDPKCARMLLERARSDLIILEEATPRVRDESFGFHVQQAAEKSLKAWLALLGRKYPLTHELDLLFERLDSAGASTGFFRSLAEFTPYAVEYRYEGVGPDHEPIDRPAATTLVAALVRHVADLLAAMGVVKQPPDSTPRWLASTRRRDSRVADRVCRTMTEARISQRPPSDPDIWPSAAGTLFALALTILLAGCGASLGRQLRDDIGRATLRDIQLHVPEVLADHGYSIHQRRKTRTRIYYETSWLYRAPFDDELERGVREVRTRFIVQGRRGGSDFYDVELRVENAVRGILPSGDWSPLATPDFRNHMRSVSDELMMNINAGVRIRGGP